MSYKKEKSVCVPEYEENKQLVWYFYFSVISIVVILLLAVRFIRLNGILTYCQVMKKGKWMRAALDDTITELQIEKLNSLGVEFFEYRNGFIYTNLCVGDGDKAAVDTVDYEKQGSYLQLLDQKINMRNRSTADLEDDFERTVKRSVRIHEKLV